MFDMLTRDQLYDLHSRLYRAHDALMDRIIDPEGGKAKVPVFGEDWRIIGAALDDIRETSAEIFAEIGRRNAEETAHA